MKILSRFPKRKLEIKKSSSGEGFRKLFAVWEIKRFRYPAFRKLVLIVLTSMPVSEEMLLARWRAPVEQFLFHLMRTGFRFTMLR